MAISWSLRGAVDIIISYFFIKKKVTNKKIIIFALSSKILKSSYHEKK